MYHRILVVMPQSVGSNMIGMNEVATSASRLTSLKAPLVCRRVRNSALLGARVAGTNIGQNYSQGPVDVLKDICYCRPFIG